MKKKNIDYICERCKSDLGDVWICPECGYEQYWYDDFYPEASRLPFPPITVWDVRFLILIIVAALIWIVY